MTMLENFCICYSFLVILITVPISLNWPSAFVVVVLTECITLDHEYTKSFEDGREVDVDSDGEEKPDAATGLSKRSHHNALERKRRDHIKESFNGLRDAVPSLQGEKVSRAQILNKATEYIQDMTNRNSGHKQDIENLKRQNMQLEHRIRALERAKRDGIFSNGPTSNLPQSMDTSHDSS